jgi:hypothetical protein
MVIDQKQKKQFNLKKRKFEKKIEKRSKKKMEKMETFF